MIEISNRSRSIINEKKIKKVIELFLDYKRKSKLDVSIAFVGDKKIQKFNNEYRGINKTTDILSFSGEENLLGELIINYSQIKRQAKKFKNTINQELVFILVHGLLHLMGDNDDTDIKRKNMIKRGEEIIKELNLKI